MTQLITDISISKLPLVVSGLGLKKYAAGQIISWLYKKRVSSFDEMTNLAKDARELLKEKFEINALEVEKTLSASDGTEKFLCRASDGAKVECVFIPAEDGRSTVCISTQVGCQMGCLFCRTAGMGFLRNLTQGEMLGQLIIAMRKTKAPVTNLVLMGMGEPLKNMDAVSDALELILDSRAFGFSKRRVTLSTSGLLPELDLLSRRFGIKIAISLNATTDEIRSKIMPVGKMHKIADIIAFARDYTARTKRRVTFEYILIQGVNDSTEDAKRLAGLLSGIRAKVNLIPFNPFAGCGMMPPDKTTLEKWGDLLRSKNIQVNVRASKGREIMAACGQLATGI